MLTTRRGLVLAALVLGSSAARAGTREDSQLMATKPRIETVDPAFDRVVAPDAEISCIAEGLEFTEGPQWMASEGEGYLVFSDIPADTLYRWDEAGGLSVLRRPSYHANGNTVDTEGRLVTCEHGSRRVTRTEKDGTVTAMATTYGGKRLNSPNDVVVARDGAVWFTDPPYGIKESEREQPANHVFRLGPGAEEPVPVADDFARPNGLCFSPDESLLYIADSDHARTHVRQFRVREGKALAGGEVFATVDPPAPDGIRVDVDGRLYVTAGDGVQVFGTDGSLLGKVLLPERPTNCAFGGPGHTTLFITARPKVYAVVLKVAGAR